MDKKEKHAKMEQFRKEIVSVSSRKRKLDELTSEFNNNSFDELDVLKAIVLFKKISLVVGCENEYKNLIAAAIRNGDDKLAETAENFARRSGLN